ncbi:hypothetical protein HKX48_001918 [Thoreauomyces humboldtii]|nr:hypothetical protein HKX48_001918 [Thoreauomyces humboldtii]
MEPQPSHELWLGPDLSLGEPVAPELDNRSEEPRPRLENGYDAERPDDQDHMHEDDQFGDSTPDPFFRPPSDDSLADSDYDPSKDDDDDDGGTRKRKKRAVRSSSATVRKSRRTTVPTVPVAPKKKIARRTTAPRPTPQADRRRSEVTPSNSASGNVQPPWTPAVDRLLLETAMNRFNSLDFNVYARLAEDVNARVRYDRQAVRTRILHLCRNNPELAQLERGWSDRVGRSSTPRGKRAAGEEVRVKREW